MNLFEARHLAKTLMHAHGLHDWTFRFDHAKRRFGSCSSRKRVITLSKSLTTLNSIVEVRDTILHEIAHALTPGDGHGEKWKNACVQVGAKPIRCYTDAEVVSPPRRAARYAIGCRTCGWWMDRHRINRRVLLCKKCSGGVIYRENETRQHFIVETSGRSARIRRIA